ncbi:MAG: type II toxin-antitoxin system Phd/YefM family antitoxin [Caldilineaceae bacterium SB0661_bin_32]|uniref:Antitoxin n=1 Tax=Caldilineaceae bacterium SB0661_bin_32 TaxID=2605255 RepID=A0A6B1DCN9_9CHLR|nr:type II toxin-antitoxin system Phd/YefM family antitoxin [Caldilineaceae bacterium SB0661_bin_32]
MPARTMSSDQARSSWRRLLESALTGDCDTIIERNGQPVGALIPFDDYIAVLETLEDLRLARQAMPALEEWQADPSTARPWREVLAELRVEVDGK